MMDVLVVGGGSIGERHLRCFLNTGRVKISLCDVNQELLDRIAQNYEVEQTFTSFEEALEAGPDAVVICTPAHLHIRMALACAEQNIPMLIEKPLSTTMDGVDQLTELVNQKNLPVSVAYVARANPILQDFRKELQSGRFGEPLQLVFSGGQNFPFFRPAYRDIYYNNRATGGGAIQDALTHGLNFCEWLVGPMTQLVADADHKVLEGVEVEDTVHVIARHGAVMATYNLNQYQAPNETTVTVVCTKGTVRYEPFRSRWVWQTDIEGDWTAVDFPAIERDDGFVSQANAFLDTIEKETPPLCSLEEGLQTFKVNLAILDCLETLNWKKLS